MKEIEPHKIDQTEIHAVKPAKTERVVSVMKPKPGLRVWELEVKTMIIREAEFSNEKIELVPEVNMITRQDKGLIEKVVRDVIKKDGFRYCCALNYKSADKRFAKMLGRVYPKNKKPTRNE